MNDLDPTDADKTSSDDFPPGAFRYLDSKLVTAFFEDIRKRRRGLIFSLKQQDDWSFILKVVCLVEAALTSALCARIGSEKIQKTLAREIPLKQRLRLAADLGLLSKEEVKRVEKLANIRNELAHDIAHVEFQFSTYFADKSRFKGFVESFADFLGPSQRTDKKTRVDRNTFVRNDPKLVILAGVGLVLATLMSHHEMLALDRTKQDLDEQARALAKEQSATLQRLVSALKKLGFKPPTSSADDLDT